MPQPPTTMPKIETGESVFEKVVIDTTMTATHMVAAADFDGDGDIDLVSTAELDNTVAWFENDGSQSFTKRVIDSTLGQAYPASVEDVDGDGDVDILAGGYGSDEFVIYTNDGAGNFARAVVLPSNGPHSIFAVDMDGDGDKDLVTSSQDANIAAWYENDGNLNFTERVIDTDLARAKTAIPADVDGDGDLDVIGTSNSGFTVYWYENDGSENFTRFAVPGIVDGAYYAIAADLDGDGDQDIASVGQNSDLLSWHVNDGSENFTPVVIDNTVDGARAVAAADIDHDGDLDLFATARDGNTLNMYLNAGDGTFTKVIIDPNIDGVYGVEVFDVDQDGVLDVLSAARDSGEVSIHLQSKAHTASIGVGGSLVIDTGRLSTRDDDSAPNQLTYTVTSAPEDGELRLDGVALGPNGTFTQADIDAGRIVYVHDGVSSGDDAFAFSVSDGTPGAEPVRGSFTFNLDSSGPEAADDAFSTQQNTNLVLDIDDQLLANDSDPDGDPLRLDGFDQPQNGSVTDNGDGTLTYAPEPGFEGVDSFTYTVTDGTLADTATVSVTVTSNPGPVPVYDAPGEMVFDGTAGAVLELPHAPIYNFAEGTVAFSFVAANTSGPKGLFTKDASGFGGGGNHLAIYLNGTDLIVRFQNGSSTSLRIPGIEAGTEYDLAATFDGSGSKVYLDGALVAETPLVMDWTANVEVIQWGGRGWGSPSGQTGFDAPMNGTISDKKIFAQALSPQQVAELFADGPVNANPVAVDDAITLDEDTSRTFDPSTNDSDPDSPTLTVSAIAADPANGTAVIETNGQVTYTPDADFAGTDSFDVVISDGEGGTDISTVTATVTPVNDDPVANDDTASTTLGVATVIDLTANDSDPDGDALTVTALTDPSNGTVTNNNDGTVTYTPNPGYVGPDSFTYTIDDLAGGTPQTATVTLDVLAAPNAPPVAADDDITVDEDQSLTFQPGSNDSDPENDPVVASDIVTGPANGTAEVTPAGEVTYTPDPDYSGPDSFVIEVTDGNGGTDQSTVNVSVTPVNDPPVAKDDTGATAEGTSVDLNLLANDTDPEGDALSVTNLSDPANGAVVDNGDGTVTYTPDAGFEGVDSFTYTASDGPTESETATVSVTVTSNSGPVPVYDAPGEMVFDGTAGSVLELPHAPIYNFAEGTVAFSFVAANTSGPKGLFTKDASGFGGGGNHLAIYLNGSDLIVRFQNGSSTSLRVPGIEAGTKYDLAATFDGSGSKVYLDGALVAETPLVMDWTTNVEVIQWGGRGWGSPSGQTGFDAPMNGTISDKKIFAQALSPQQVADLFADGPVNANPVAVDDAITLDEDTSRSFDPTTNDSDPDSPTLTVSAIAANPANGTAVIEVNGQVTYTPDADFAGTDSFDVVISDGEGGTDISTVTATVTPVNDDPVANDDTASTTLGVATVIDLTANDSDPDGDALTVTELTDPSNGTVANNNDGTVTYTPNPDYVGPDSFTYTIDDLAGGTPQTATVTLDVLAAPNGPPVAADDDIAVDEDQSLTFQPGANDSDPENDPVVASDIVTGPANGTAEVTAGGEVTYTPAPDYSGPDSFVIEVTDGNGGTDQSTVNVSVTPINDPPVANDDTGATAEGTPVDLNLVANDTDPDGDALSVTNLSDPANGAVTDNGDGTVTYTPDPGFEGVDSFTYTSSDGPAESETATVSVTVTSNSGPVPVYDAPGEMVFDGTAGAVLELPHAPVYNFAEGTVAFSFVAANTSGPKGLFTKDASGFGGGGNHLAIYLNGSDLIVRFQNGSSASLRIPGIEAGTEYDLAATFDASGSKVFLDGALVAETPLVMDWTANVEVIQWGGRGWGSPSGQTGFDAPMNGTISDKKIFAQALSPQQVADLFADPPVNASQVALDEEILLSEASPAIAATFVEPNLRDSTFDFIEVPTFDIFA